MPTLKQNANTIISSITTLNKAIGSKVQPLYIEQLIRECGPQALLIYYNGSRNQGANYRIPGDFIQRFELEIVPSQQNSDVDWIEVECPALVNINTRTDGLIYAGNFYDTRNFDKAMNREDVSNMMQRGYGKDGKNIIVCYEETKLLIWGNKQLKKLRVGAVLQNPDECPGFNIVTDKWPISNDVIPIMEQLIWARVVKAMGQPEDTIVDGVKTTDKSILKQNIG